MPLIPNLSLYLIQKFDRLALWGNLTILELHFAETQEFLFVRLRKFIFGKIGVESTHDALIKYQAMTCGLTILFLRITSKGMSVNTDF